jgi:hypothetical protein
VSTFNCPGPVIFIIWIVPEGLLIELQIKEIFALSGDQFGIWQLSGEEVFEVPVNLVCPEPSAFITKISFCPAEDIFA